jgi:ABC-type glutathione transport system ATPase component
MADEPTGALDSDTGEQVLETLKKLSKKTLVIVVSHDKEFAEKYADRIIHLIDGQVAQDVTFTEKQMDANVSEQADALVIREGADLSEAEKDTVAKAVKERKSIEVVENLSFRDKHPTGEVLREEEEPSLLKKSQMKARSAMQMGAKSLIVKPLRLILTVLISAIAFAISGRLQISFTVFCFSRTEAGLLAAYSLPMAMSKPAQLEFSRHWGRASSR